nr:hypothetical protein [Tanacetum cinerariifolium]
EEGIDCLPNSTIFEQIALMGKPTRKDTQVPQPSGPIKSVTNEFVHKELSDRLRVKKLEKRNRSKTQRLKRLYKVGLSARVESFRDEESLGEDAFKQGRRIDDIDANKDIALVSNDADKEMFDVDVLGGEEMFIAGQNENLVEGKEKREGTELEQEITKKQKVEDDKEKAELKLLMETISDEEEVAIDAIPLAVKSPRIVD